MPNFFTDFLRGLEGGTRGLPQAIQMRERMGLQQQQRDADLERQAAMAALQQMIQSGDPAGIQAAFPAAVESGGLPSAPGLTPDQITTEMGPEFTGIPEEVVDPRLRAFMGDAIGRQDRERIAREQAAQPEPIKWQYNGQRNFFYNPTNPNEQKPGPQSSAELKTYKYDSSGNFFWDPTDPTKTFPGPKQDLPESWSVHPDIPYAMVNRSTGEVKFDEDLRNLKTEDEEVGEAIKTKGVVASLTMLIDRPVVMTQEFHKLPIKTRQAIMDANTKDSKAIIKTLRVTLSPGTTNVISDGDTALASMRILENAMNQPRFAKQFDPLWAPINLQDRDDVDLNEFDSLIRTTRQIVGKYLEGGKLMPDDELKYKRMLPFLGELELPWVWSYTKGDILEVAKRKLKNVNKLIKIKQDQYKAISGAEERPSTTDIFDPAGATKAEFNEYLQEYGDADNASELLELYDQRFPNMVNFETGAVQGGAGGAGAETGPFNMDARP